MKKKTLKRTFFEKWHINAYVCVMMGKFVCGKRGGGKNERSRPSIDRVPVTFVVMELKIILYLIIYVKQTVC